MEYAVRVAERLRGEGLRVEVDGADDTVGEKIRRALTAHHPAVLVVGDRDVEAGTVGLRRRGEDHERRGLATRRGGLRAGGGGGSSGVSGPG